ncbi:MAG: AmmeMemoRadiSam system protein A [Gammaproteobacteria bacterium]|jgi:AmmeMemoRadiSam system protein A
MQPSPCVDLDAGRQSRLLAIARQSIESGFEIRSAPGIDLAGDDDGLRYPAAAFVTLTQAGALRGCVGSLEARQALVQAVADAAFSAAFRDRRFQPLAASELEATRIEISVLSATEPVAAGSRQALLEQLRPGIDGLIVEDRGRRATFLPKVWEHLPSAEAFLDELMLKAGLDAGHWSQSLRLQRYSTQTFAEN